MNIPIMYVGFLVQFIYMCERERVNLNFGRENDYNPSTVGFIYLENS